MKTSRIYIIDDESSMIQITRKILEGEGYQVGSNTSSEKALEDIRKDPPNLILSDIRMPHLDGFEICKELKSDPRLASIPLILVSIKTHESYVAMGLELGAEDYIRKPFHNVEFLARVKKALKRAASPPPSKRVKIGTLELDYDRLDAKIEGKALRLRPKEFELLATLASREGHVLTRGTLSRSIWRIDHIPTSRTIDSHVDRLRKKLGNKAHWIQSLKGVGYRFESELEE